MVANTWRRSSHNYTHEFSLDVGVRLRTPGRTWLSQVTDTCDSHQRWLSWKWYGLWMVFFPLEADHGWSGLQCWES